MEPLEKKKLADLYKDSYSIESVDKNVRLDIGEFFVDLEAIEVEKTAHNQSREKYDPFLHRDLVAGRRPIPGTSIRTTTKILNQNCRRVLIIGSPGTGKSTLCKKILHEFYSKNLWQDDFSDIVFIQLRNLNHVNITKLRPQLSISENEKRDQYQKMIFKDRNVFGRDITDTLKNSKNILYILDGLDEIQDLFRQNQVLKEFVQRLQSQENVILATRSYVSLNFSEFDSVLEIKGFNHIHVRKYIRNVLQQTKPNNYIEEEENIISYIQHRSVNDMVTIPILLDIFLYTWESIEISSQPQVTTTKLYLKLALKLWLKFINSQGINADDIDKSDFFAVSSKVKSQCSILCQMACKWAQDDSLDFTLEECRGREGITEKSKLSTRKLPFLHRVNPKEQNQERQIYEFIHLTMLEFFFAFHLLYNCSESEFCEFVCNQKHNSKYRVVFTFLSGLLCEGIFPNDLKRKRLERYFDYLESYPVDLNLNSAYHYKLLVECFQESPFSHLLDSRETSVYKDLLHLDVIQPNSNLRGFLHVTPKLFKMALEKNILHLSFLIEFPALSNQLIDRVDKLVQDISFKVRIYCGQPFYSDHTIKKLCSLLTTDNLLKSTFYFPPRKPLCIILKWISVLQSLNEEERDLHARRNFDALSNTRMLSLQDTTELCQHLVAPVDLPQAISPKEILKMLITNTSLPVELLIFLKNSFEFMEQWQGALETIINEDMDSAFISERIMTLSLVMEICPSEKLVKWLFCQQFRFPDLKALVWYVLCYPPFDIDLSPLQMLIFKCYLQYDDYLTTLKLDNSMEALVRARTKCLSLRPFQRGDFHPEFELAFVGPDGGQMYLQRYIVALLHHKRLPSDMVVLGRKILHLFDHSDNIMDFLLMQLHDKGARDYIVKHLSLSTLRKSQNQITLLTQPDQRFTGEQLRQLQEFVMTHSLYNFFDNEQLLDEFENCALEFWNQENTRFLVCACQKFVKSGLKDHIEFTRKNICEVNIRNVYERDVKMFDDILTADQLGIYLAIVLVYYMDHVYIEFEIGQKKGVWFQKSFGDLGLAPNFVSSMEKLHVLSRSCSSYKIDFATRLCTKLDSGRCILALHYFYIAGHHRGGLISNLVLNLSDANFKLIFLIILKEITSTICNFPLYVIKGQLHYGSCHSTTLNPDAIGEIYNFFGLSENCRQLKIQALANPNLNSVTHWCAKVADLTHFESLVVEDVENRKIITEVESFYNNRVLCLQKLPQFENRIRRFFKFHSSNGLIPINLRNFLQSPFHVDLSSSKFTDSDILWLCQILRSNQGTHVHTLVLSDNEVTKMGFCALMHIVPTVRMRHLILDRNFIHFDESTFKETLWPLSRLQLKILESDLEIVDLSFNFMSRNWIKNLIGNGLDAVDTFSTEDASGNVVVQYLRVNNKFNLIYRRDCPSLKIVPAICKFRQDCNFKINVDFISENRGCIAWAEASKCHWYSSHVVLLIERIYKGQRELCKADLVKNEWGQCQVRYLSVDPLQRSNVNGYLVQSLKSKLNAEYGIPKRGYATRTDEKDPIADVICRIHRSKDLESLKSYSIHSRTGGVYVNCVLWANEMLKPIISEGVLEISLPSTFKILPLLWKYIDSIVLMVIAIAMFVLVALFSEK